MNERAAIDQAQQGNTDAFRQIFEDNKNKIFALAYQYTKNAEDSEDILQDTFIKAFHALHKFRNREDTNFSAWLYRIGINCSIDHLRRNKMKRDRYIDSDSLSSDSKDDSGTNPENRGRAEEIRKQLEKTLEKLSFRQRTIFILRHYQQFSIKEIAEFLGCSEGSVKKQLFRAFSTIKEDFKCFFQEADHEMQQI